MENGSDKVEPAIVEAVIDSSDRRWIRYGGYDRSVWLALDDLSNNPQKVFCSVASVGKLLLSSRSKELFRQEIERHDTFRPALLAPRPGWTDGAYIFGDGTVQMRTRDNRPMIVGFEGDDKFGVVGNLENWKTAILPLIVKQPLPIFAMCYAFAGLILALAPPDYQNPIVEIVGAPQSGKTVLCIAAGSVHGGDPNSSLGFGLSWDRTLNSLDEKQHLHRDGLLFLDEANHQEASDLRKAIFKLTQTSSRERLGEVSSEHSKVAVLSSSNSALMELVGGRTHADAAVRSRVLTLRADRAYGIFDTVPEGFVSAREAVEALHAAATGTYGSAARTFIRYLSGFREEKVRAAIRRGLTSTSTQALVEGIEDARISKIVALTYVAGWLAQNAGVFPFDLRMMQQGMAALFHENRTPPPASFGCSALNQVLAYIERHEGSFLEIGDPSLPLDGRSFDSRPGFWLERGTRCLIPTKRFEAAISNSRQVLKTLYNDQRLDFESGTKVTFSKKASSRLTSDRGRRGYVIRVDVAA